MRINGEIFKAYDIRAVYGKDLSDSLAYFFGRAYATWLKQNGIQGNAQIAVGSDARLSSPILKEQLIKGLLDSGINVVDIGTVSTPTFFFGVGYFNYYGGIQVTASHNPKEWNGFKIVSAKGKPVDQNTGLKEIQKILEEDSYVETASLKGKLSANKEVLAAQIAEILKGFDVNKIRPLKIVADPANSVAALDLEAIFEKLPCDLVKINFELDGNFPAHEGNPLMPENTKQAREKVKSTGADLGIAADSDGDRYFFINEKGEMIRQSIISGILAQIELKKNPGAKIIYDARPGRINSEMISEAGGIGIAAKTGRSIIGPAVFEQGAVFGSEATGHFFYPKPYGTYEMPLIVTLNLLEYISEQNKPVSEIVRPYDKYFYSGEINFELENREQALSRLALLKSRYNDAKQSELDGLTVEYPDFWFNVRPSNTEPLLRFSLEAKSEAVMKVKTKEVADFIKETIEK